ncbi:hypothetical protein Tco_0845196 [Tanacetum coccineum]
MTLKHGVLYCQIVDKCKTGLGYNVVPPPYTGNFMPLKLDLSFFGLKEFTSEPIVIKPIVEKSEAKASEAKPKTVRKNNGALIIEDWVSDSEEENVSQTKIEKKTFKPSFVKIEFVKPKQQEKTARKTVNHVEQNRQNIHTPRGNQRNWNNMMSQRLGKFKKQRDELVYVEMKVKLERRQNLSKITFCYHYGLLIHHFPKIQRVLKMMDPNLQVMMEKVDEDLRKDSEGINQDKEDNVNSTNNVNAASTNEVNVVGGKTSIKLLVDPDMLSLEDISIFDLSNDDEDVDAEADMNNLDTSIQVSPILTSSNKLIILQQFLQRLDRRYHLH